MQRKSRNGTKKNSEKSDISKKNKKHVWLSARLRIEGRLNEGPRLQRSIGTKNEVKQNKRNKHQRKNAMASASQTPGGYKFAPLVASQQGRANQNEPCFGLSSSWFFPSRSGIPRHAVVVQPWFSLQISISP